MKYFIDTEFIEGFHKPLFGKRRYFIDLISIGIVAEDGRTYSAISNEWNYKDADNWVKQNVIIPLYINVVSGDMRNMCDGTNFHKMFGLTNSQIRDAIKKFVNPLLEETPLHDKAWNDHLNKLNASENRPIEFYGYYADYDWVLFCSLFGRMIDLPKDFPMYCRDLKQILDEKAESIIPKKVSPENKYYAQNFESALKILKAKQGYPAQENEHNALADAQWNKKLYDFIKSL